MSTNMNGATTPTGQVDEQLHESLHDMTITAEHATDHRNTGRTRSDVENGQHATSTLHLSPQCSSPSFFS